MKRIKRTHDLSALPASSGSLQSPPCVRPLSPVSVTNPSVPPAASLPPAETMLKHSESFKRKRSDSLEASFGMGKLSMELDWTMQADANHEDESETVSGFLEESHPVTI